MLEKIKLIATLSYIKSFIEDKDFEVSEEVLQKLLQKSIQMKRALDNYTKEIERKVNEMEKETNENNL